MIIKDKRFPIRARCNCTSPSGAPGSLKAPQLRVGNAGGPRASGGHVRNARTHGFGWVPAFLSAPIHIATVESFKNNERVGHPVSRVASERGPDASAPLRLRCVPHPQGPALNPGTHLYERSPDSRRVGPGRIHRPGRTVPRGHSAPVPQATDRAVPMRRRARPGHPDRTSPRQHTVRHTSECPDEARSRVPDGAAITTPGANALAHRFACPAPASRTALAC